MGKALLTAILGIALALPAPAASALENEELLALVAMPLAVAAVSEITDVPMNELIDVVSLLNDAAVPPAQFVEVIRYVPVALVVDDDQPEFVEFVRVQEQQGLRGTALVNVIEERLRTYDLPAVDLDVPETRIVRVIDQDADFVPVVVRERVTAVRSGTRVAGHPHGGPPGQLKKAAGVQTGAEIVHGSTRGRGGDDDRVVVRRERSTPKPEKREKVRVVKAGRDDDDDRGRRQRVARPRGGDDDGAARGRGHGRGGDDRGRGNGKGKGNAKGKGNGKGKG